MSQFNSESEVIAGTIPDDNEEGITRPNESVSKEQIYQAIMADKRGKEDLNAGLGLYCMIGTPRVDFDELMGMTVTAMRECYDVVRWATDFGRVIVCVNPGKIGVEISSISDPRQKLNVLIRSSRLIDPRELAKQQDGKNIIFMNSKPATLEGLATSFLHLFDQLVWEKYQVLVANKQHVPRRNLYLKVLEDVCTEGVSLRVLSELDILKLYEKGLVIPRPYPSRAIASLPFILGAVGYDSMAESRHIPNRISHYERNVGLISISKNEALPEGSLRPVCLVTLGKPLHAGHLTSLALARLSVPDHRVVLVSNDIGPRVEELIMKLSKTKGLSVRDTICLLKEGRINADEVVLAYRTPDDSADSLMDGDDRRMILEGGCLKPVENMIVPLLGKGGYDIDLISQSSCLGGDISLGSNSAWAGIGFLPVFTGGQTLLLIKEGRPSIVATNLKVIQAVANMPGEQNGVLLVDATEETLQAAQFSDAFTGVRAMQMKGAGVGYGGCIGRGSIGGIPEIDLLVEKFGVDLAKVMTIFALTTNQISDSDPRISNVVPFYDFSDSQRLMEKLDEANNLLVALRSFRDDLIKRIGIADPRPEGKPQDPSINKNYRFIKGLSHDQRLRRLRTPEIISGKDDSFVGVVGDFVKGAKSHMRTKIGFSIPDDLEGFIVKHLMEFWGNRNEVSKIELIKYMRGEGLISSIGNLPQKDRKITCVPLKCAYDCGYESEVAIARATAHRNGELYVSKRIDPYFSNLIGVRNLLEDGNISEDDLPYVLEMVNLCFQKLGFI